MAGAIDDLAEAVAMLAEQYAGQQETFFLADLLFELLGQAMADGAACRDEIAALTARLAVFERRTLNL